MISQNKNNRDYYVSLAKKDYQDGIRLNPNDEQNDKNTIHISLGAQKGIHLLFK